MIPNRFVNVAIVALGILTVTELYAFVSIRARSSLYRANQMFPMPAGYLSDKRFIDTGGAPCVLIRLSTDSCPYCRRDRALYARFAETAKTSKCKLLTIAPKRGQIAPTGHGGADLPLEFVDMDFARVFSPFSTPQTLLLNHEGKLAWYREGAMDEHSLNSGLRALATLR